MTPLPKKATTAMATLREKAESRHTSYPDYIFWAAPRHAQIWACISHTHPFDRPLRARASSDDLAAFDV